MTTVFVDVETVGAIHLGPTERLALAGAVKVPANYKDPEKIAKYRASKAGDAFRSTSLVSTAGRLLCVAVAIDDGPVHVFGATYEGCGTPEEYDAEERAVLAMLEDYLLAHPRPLHGVNWCGHNVAAFDLRWLKHRAWKYHMGALAGLIPFDKWSKRVKDTLTMWNGPDPRSSGGSRLDDIARFLGLPGKPDGMDGSKVYDAWLEGRQDEIESYCAADVELTRAVYLRIGGRL